MPANRMRGRVVPLSFFVLATLLALTLGLAPKALAEQADGDAAASTTTSATEELEISSIDELSGKKIGMVSGAAFDTLVLDKVEGSKQNDIMYFNSNAETVGALQAGKIDAMITDSPIAKTAPSTSSSKSG